MTESSTRLRSALLQVLPGRAPPDRRNVSTILFGGIGHDHGLAGAAATPDADPGVVRRRGVGARHRGGRAAPGAVRARHRVGRDRAGRRCACAVAYLAVGMPVRLHEGRARTASFEEMLLLGSVAVVAGGHRVRREPLHHHGAAQRARSSPPSSSSSVASWGRAMWRRVVERDLTTLDRRRDRRAGAAGRRRRGRSRADRLDAARPGAPAGRRSGCSTTTRASGTCAIRGVPVLGTTDDLAERGPGDRGPHRRSSRCRAPASELVREVSHAAARRRGRPQGAARADRSSSPTTSGSATSATSTSPTCSAATSSTPTSTSIAGYLTGQRVLVTGAGGSIGSELCRQIDRFGPAELIMLDRDESALHAVQLSHPRPGAARLRRRGPRRHPRRATRSTRIFAERRPEVVFHAAALKHLPMLEQYPGEAVQDQRPRHPQRARRGASRRRRALRQHLHRQGRQPEQRARLLQADRRAAHRRRAPHRDGADTCLACASATCWAAAARCSPRSRAQIAAGGPVTVTHPDVTRYFMTIEEACQLVIQAGAIGRAGRGAGARHGRAGADRRRGPAADRAGTAPGARSTTPACARARSCTRSCSATASPTHVRPEHPLISPRAGAARSARSRSSGCRPRPQSTEIGARAARPVRRSERSDGSGEGGLT